MFFKKRLLIAASILVWSLGAIAMCQGCSDQSSESLKRHNPTSISMVSPVSQSNSVTAVEIEPMVMEVVDEPVKVKPKVREIRIVYSASAHDVHTLFKEINYSLVLWNEGVREIPRVYITDISSRWQTQSQKMDVKSKKAIFFQFTIPIVLRANELILEDRQKLLALMQHSENLSEEQNQWLTALAMRYKVVVKNEHFQRSKMEKLLSRVDVIPPSLALAQAAEESGWGTSRFAILGNSLFGQWAFSKSAMRPKQQRKELGDYGLARFDTPLDAVNSYMLNLNTHLAYKPLRELRSQMKREQKKVTGKALATTLDKYSERGQAYVDSLHAMMRINHLGEADDAYLWDREIIYLVPIEDMG